MQQPPFTLTPTVLNLSMQIMRLLGELGGLQLTRPAVLLRKSNRIKTIQASLAIEGNTLSVEQITDLIDGAAVIAPQQDILEVKNAIAVYDRFMNFRYTSLADFKKAHKGLMYGLIADAGSWRQKNVGVYSGERVTHMAPPFKRVPKLMTDLFAFLKQKDDMSLLIKACIFHYELEFIHPFSDGNGRMGRLWQHLILSNFHEVFQFVAIESLIKAEQKNYYAVLAKCDAKGESTDFVEFSLQLIERTLQQYVEQVAYQPKTAAERLEWARSKLSDGFSRKQYSEVFKTISMATASRDLKYGLDHGVLVSTGKQRATTYAWVVVPSSKA